MFPDACQIDHRFHWQTRIARLADIGREVNPKISSPGTSGTALSVVEFPIVVGTVSLPGPSANAGDIHTTATKANITELRIFIAGSQIRSFHLEYNKYSRKVRSCANPDVTNGSWPCQNTNASRAHKLNSIELMRLENC